MGYARTQLDIEIDNNEFKEDHNYDEDPDAETVLGWIIQVDRRLATSELEEFLNEEPDHVRALYDGLEALENNNELTYENTRRLILQAIQSNRSNNNDAAVDESSRPARGMRK